MDDLSSSQDFPPLQDRYQSQREVAVSLQTDDPAKTPPTTVYARFRVNWPGFTLDVDLTLPSQGVTALFGHSGSGKTTVLRCIAGLERPKVGFLSFKGHIWQDDQTWLPTYRRPIGYVFQEASLFPHLSVLGNLRYGVKRSTSTGLISLDHIIDLLGIEALLSRKPDRLSGGEQQRVGIARALAVNPQILLMDEPLAALDVARKQEILPYLERLRDELAIPMIYVSHAPDEVARLADYLVVLADGRMRVQGPLRTTLTQLDVPLRLGEDVGVVLEAIVTEHDATWHLMRVAFDGGSLWLRGRAVPLGQRVRVRILARDVSLARLNPEQTSILNQLAGEVDAIADDDHPGLTLVRVKLGRSAVVARLTRRSATALSIQPGQTIWVQIKSVALLA